MSLIVKNLHAATDGTEILKGLSLEVPKGEIHAIMGPNGSGKSTLLNIVGGLDYPTEGNVWVDKVDLSGLNNNELIDFRKNKIGFVFQSFNLIPVLTAFENVEFVMLLQKRSKDERRKRAMDLMKAVGLEDKAQTRPGQLSGGQQQSVAVARALAPKPA